MAVFNKLKVLDAYPKISEDFYSRTLSGGVITLVSSIFMTLLFITEFRKLLEVLSFYSGHHASTFTVIGACIVVDRLSKLPIR